MLSELIFRFVVGISSKGKSGTKKGLDEALVARAREAMHRARKKLGHRLTIRKIKGHSGDVHNEVADALAAIGRTTSAGKEPLTAELMDRIQRAIDGIGGEEPPDITSQGFAL